MNTFIVYDENGKIIFAQSGTAEVQDAGVIFEEIPEGYYPESVNVETKELVLEKRPPTKEEQQIEALNQAVLGLMDMMNV